MYSPAHTSTVGVIKEHTAALRGHRSRVAVTHSLTEPEINNPAEEDGQSNEKSSPWILELLLAGFVFLVPLLLSALCFMLLWIALGSANKLRHL